MIFVFFFAFAAGLVALGVGFAFLIWGYRKEGKCIGLSKVAGYIITIASAVILLCTLCTGFKVMKYAHMQGNGGKTYIVSPPQPQQLQTPRR